MARSDLLISQAEHESRIETLRDKMKSSRCAALYLTNPSRILYATGFSHISTERPIALVVPQDGPVFMMGPHLEEDHVKQDSPIIEEFHSYPDYPGTSHPITHFVKVLREKKLAASRIATDSPDGAAGGWGYRGPRLSELLRESEMIDGRDFVDNQRLVKSKQEIRLLNESARWAEKAHDILIDNITPGAHDALIGVKASYEALKMMLNKLGSSYRQLKAGLSPVVIGCRGQVGPESAIPHAVFSKRKIRRGDVLVTEAGVEIGGYTSELERTLIVGRPGPKEKKYFETMLEAQNAALESFRSGIPCSKPNDAARRVVESCGLGSMLRHHVGHGIGLDGHEPPWLDPGDKTIMGTGMVFSCEPGLYSPGLAGFRHSDTLEVKKNGMELITKYPRDLEQLIV